MTLSEKLSTTQIGAIAESLVANAIMVQSKGRLSPFVPLADDDGIDLLVYDKKTGRAVSLQIKARTVTLFKPGTRERGNQCHFTIRQATFRHDRHAWLLGVLLAEDLCSIECGWVMPMSVLPKIANKKTKTFAISPNRGAASRDKFTEYRCQSADAIVKRILRVCSDTR